MWTPCEDRFQNDDAFSNGDALSRVLHDYFSNCFTVNISSEQLLSQSNQFKTTVTFSEQLLLQGS